jgi:probable rRNA maturation factor
VSKAASTGGVRVVINAEGLRVPVAAARLRAAVETVLAAQKVKQALISLTLMTPRKMAALNEKHLQHRGPTDIITFGFRDPVGALIGDLYLCPEVAAANAKAFGVSQREELLRLAVHGTLHVLGYEHPEGERRTASPMWKLQERLLNRVLEA